MEQRISFQVLGEMTRIPPALLSNYAIGKRQISRHHLPILSIALDVPPNELRGYAPASLVFVDEDELTPTNPLPVRVNRILLSWYPRRTEAASY